MVDRRRRRRTERRQAVIEVALGLFEQQGYSATTVESIAATAGISLRSFYRYFDSKDGVLATLGSTLIEELLERTPARPSVSSLALGLAQLFDERLHQKGVELFLRLLREEPELMDKAALWRQQWAQELARGLGDRGPRRESSLTDLVISRMAVAVVAIAVDRWVTQQADGSITTRSEEVLRILETHA